jgi:hypothetical protein
VNCAPIFSNLSPFPWEKEWVIPPYTPIQYLTDRFDKALNVRVITVSILDPFVYFQKQQVLQSHVLLHEERAGALQAQHRQAPIVPPPMGAGYNTLQNASPAPHPAAAPAPAPHAVGHSASPAIPRSPSTPSGLPQPTPQPPFTPMLTSPSPGQSDPRDMNQSVLGGLSNGTSDPSKVKLVGFVRNINRDPFLPLSFPVFGVPLELVMEYQGIGYVPLIVAKCIQYLWNRLETVGLFRVEGLQSDVQKLMDRFNRGDTPDLEEINDPILVAHLLKKFFQMLPEPILTYELYNPLLATTSIENEAERVSAIRDQCDRLPVVNHSLLEMFFGFLKHFESHSERNKMGVNNIATIFSPSFLKCKNETPEQLLNNNAKVLKVLADIIKHSEEIFGVLVVQNLEERFKLLEELGSGNFGVVRKCQDLKTGQYFAVKSVSLANADPKGIESLRNEVTILKKIRHPNTIQLYALCETPRVIHIITEFVPNGALLDEIFNRGSFNEKDARHIVYQLLSTLDYLHTMGVVHRGSFGKILKFCFEMINDLVSDIKPDNILLTSNQSLQIKLADFGISKIFEETVKLKTGAGTPGI